MSVFLFNSCAGHGDTWCAWFERPVTTVLSKNNESCKNKELDQEILHALVPWLVQAPVSTLRTPNLRTVS